MRRSEIAYDGDQAGNKRSLCGVRHGSGLTIEERDLGSIHDVGAVVTRGCLQQEERFDIAQDGNTQAQSCGTVPEPTELRLCDGEATATRSRTLQNLNIAVGGRLATLGQLDCL